MQVEGGPDRGSVLAVCSWRRIWRGNRRLGSSLGGWKRQQGAAGVRLLSAVICVDHSLAAHGITLQGPCAAGGGKEGGNPWQVGLWQWRWWRQPVPSTSQL